jgi:hypothetical protein
MPALLEVQLRIQSVIFMETSRIWFRNFQHTQWLLRSRASVAYLQNCVMVVWLNLTFRMEKMSTYKTRICFRVAFKRLSNQVCKTETWSKAVAVRPVLQSTWFTSRNIKRVSTVSINLTSCDFIIYLSLICTSTFIFKKLSAHQKHT